MIALWVGVAGLVLSTVFEYENPGLLVAWLMILFGFVAGLLAAMYGGVLTVAKKRQQHSEKRTSIS